MMPVKKTLMLISVSVYLGLVSCGGGGSGGGTTTPTLTPITADNAFEAAFATLISSDILLIFSVGRSIVDGVTTEESSEMVADNRTDTAGLIVSAISRPRGASAKIVSSRIDGLRAVEIIDESTPCLISGKLTFNAKVSSLATALQVPGDEISVIADECDDGDGDLISGTLDFTVLSVSGDLTSAPYAYAYSVGLTDFTVASGFAFDINGSATVSENSDDGVRHTLVISGNLVSYAEFLLENSTLRDFTMTRTVDDGSATFTLDYSGIAENELIGGPVRYTTTTTLAGSIDENPSSGVVKISGKNSSETIRVLDAIALDIEFDENGDDVIESTFPSTWEEILGF